MISGGVTYGIGKGFDELIDFAGKELLRAGAHGIANGLISEAFGGDFGIGFISGSLSSSSSSLLTQMVLGNNPVLTTTTAAIVGGIGAELAGGDFWEGARIGMIVNLLNHSAHKIEEKMYLDWAIRSAGFDPEDVARWTDEELTLNVAKILPKLYKAAGSPKFITLDIVNDNNETSGLATKNISYNYSTKKFSVTSGGIVYLKKTVLNSISSVASTAGHELIHMYHYQSGIYERIYNKFGKTSAHNYSEYKAYQWQINIGANEERINFELYEKYYKLVRSY